MRNMAVKMREPVGLTRMRFTAEGSIAFGSEKHINCGRLHLRLVFLPPPLRSHGDVLRTGKLTVRKWESWLSSSCAGNRQYVHSLFTSLNHSLSAKRISAADRIRTHITTLTLPLQATTSRRLLDRCSIQASS